MKALALAVCGTFLSGCSVGHDAPKPPSPSLFASFHYRDLGHARKDLRDATAVFVSEDKLALKFSCAPDFDCGPEVVFFSLTKDGLVLSRRTQSSADGDLFSISRDRVIVRSGRGSAILSFDGHENIAFGRHSFVNLPNRSSLLGFYDSSDSWRVISLDSLSPITSGVGSLVSVSDKAIAYASAGRMIIETLERKRLGSIELPKRGSASLPFPRLVNSGLLLFDEGRMVDFSGRPFQLLRAPPGWGGRFGSNTEGNRILFDRYSNTSFSLVNFLVSVLVPVPEYSNLETITILDVKTGKTCFFMNSSPKLFGFEGSYHGDISPSGELVAVTTTEELFIFHLPPGCEGG